MESCEGSHPTTENEIVHAKPTAMGDGKYEPAGGGLPDGWLEECRPRKNRNGSRTKGDLFYIDPINGYEFRSLKDVYRYLESGDISQCVTLPNKRKVDELHTAGDQSYHTGKPSRHTQLDTAAQSNQYDIPRATSALRDVQREAVQVEASESKSIRSGSIEHTPGKAESATTTGVNVEQKPKEKKQKTKRVKGIVTPIRSSPRLAALKISQEASNNAPRDEPISTYSDATNQSQPKQIQKPKQKANSSVLPERKDGTPTASSSEKFPHPAEFFSSSEKFEDKNPSVPNQVQGAPPEAPVLTEQVGQGETFDSMPGSALSSLFRHVWSDPCLVFAFRTLMGDIPVLNDTRSSAYDGNRNYFLPPQNLSKGLAPNWSSSVYDGNRDHNQVDHVGLSVPRKSDNVYSSGWFPPQ